MAELKTKLKWYVLNYSFNERKVKPYNVLGYWDEDIKKARKKMKTKAELKEWLNKEFMYHYWSKAECETMMGGFTTEPEELEKIDIYTQLKPNLDIITDYVITTLGLKNLK